MIWKFVVALVVWIVVTILLSLFGGLLVTIDQEVTVKIGQFLKDSSMILGFLSALAYFFFGGDWRPRINR